MEKMPKVKRHGVWFHVLPDGKLTMSDRMVEDYWREVMNTYPPNLRED